jgi:hypothetical protein
VMAFDSDFGGNGGNLSISFTKVPPPIVELTLDPTGHFNAKTGTTTLSGTYTCSGVFTLRGSGLASQSVGKSTISGLFTFFAEGACDGAPHPWSAEVSPQSGQFKGGKTQVVASVFTCDDPFEGCIVRNVEQTVKLKGGNGGASAAATEVQLFLPAVQGSQP